MQEVHTQAGVRVVYMRPEVQQVYMRGDYLWVGWMHRLLPHTYFVHWWLSCRRVVEAGCKVVWLVGDLVGERVHCKNCSGSGWSKRLCSKLVGETLAGFRQKGDCKEQAGVLVGKMEKAFLAVARVDCKKLQQ